ncbi:MAG: hypothetical protein A2Z32_01150 [Chloroflexi bacterium RBG_16_69_14]|nr:MAG: hypothetical protein A2Z32_01150 [Chloroflexi bacterium RBG_16_69_14]
MYPSLGRFEPRLETLTAGQRSLWPKLVDLPADVVLYGGTALALRLGHRPSVDFDFFLARSFVPGELRGSVPLLRDAPTIQSAPDTLVISVAGVRVAIYGVAFPALAAPDLAHDTGLPVASLADLGATKVKAVLDRAEVKDYLDISALLAAGLNLAEMLGGATALFGPAFNAMLVLKALTSFDDGDLSTLPEAQRGRLREAVLGVGRIPVVGARLPAILPEASTSS